MSSNTAQCTNGMCTKPSSTDAMCTKSTPVAEASLSGSSSRVFNTIDWANFWSTTKVDKGTMFDLGGPSKPLALLLQRNRDGKEQPPLPTGRALVPGCGRGYDVINLARHGFTATGYDIGQEGVDLANENLAETVSAVSGYIDDSTPVQERDTTTFSTLTASEAKAVASRASFKQGDFFTFAPDEEFDVVFDYTFLCALQLHHRETWASQMHRVLRHGGELVTQLFPVDNSPDARTDGPPFILKLDVVKELLERHGFVQVSIVEVPPEDSPVRRKGLEYIARWKNVKE